MEYSFYLPAQFSVCNSGIIEYRVTGTAEEATNLKDAFVNFGVAKIEQR